MSKIIAVVGATSQQGGGLARAILDDPDGGFTLRALTRDPSSAAAKELAFEKAAALRDEVVELRGLLVLQAGPESLEAGAEPVRTTARVVRAGYRPPGRSGRRR